MPLVLPVASIPMQTVARCGALQWPIQIPRSINCNMPQTVCAIIACHNRRHKTLACLDSLEQQILRTPDASLQVLLVDDGSTDGTAEAVRSLHPQVQIISGNGGLYWNGAMRLALAQAMKQSFDCYLFLNDDTVLLPHALDSLLATSAQLATSHRSNAIVVGATRGSAQGGISYGGLKLGPWWIPLRMSKLPISDQAQPCDTFNANCALIPRGVVKLVGNLDAAFTHAMGDFDFGLRARGLGCEVWVAPGVVGECEANLGLGSWTDRGSPLRTRWQRLKGPKGLPPKEWLVFTRRHSGPFWPLYWLNPYVKFWMNGIMERLTTPSPARGPR